MGVPPLIFRLARRKTIQIRFFQGRVPRKKLSSACMFGLCFRLRRSDAFLLMMGLNAGDALAYL
jgi:hypothetical protein